MNTNIEVLRELDELVEAARLLGVTQAKKGFGCYTYEDSRFERAMHESVAKHRAALLDWEAKQPAAVDEAMVKRFLEAFQKTPGDEAIGADEKVARRWLTAALSQPAEQRAEVEA